MKTILAYAKYYQSKGFSTIPLKPYDKTPAIPWKEYQTRHATDDELGKWFGNGSNLNIGIVTGNLSGIAVVDLDSEEAVELIAEHDILDAPTVLTSKGRHLYCKMKPGVTNFQKRDDLRGIDLRAEGGYVVAPPSIHPSGSKYMWMDEQNLDDAEMPELPEGILAKNTNGNMEIRELLNGVTQGQRHDALVRLVGSWLNDGFDKDHCLERAVEWNYKNQPQLTLKEMRDTVTDAYKRYSDEHKNKPVTPADKLYELASGYEVFHDQNKEAFIFLDKAAIPLRSDDARYFFAHLYKKTFNKTIAGGMLTQAISALVGKAVNESPEIHLENRIAFKDEAVWYDLCAGRSIRVTKSGWGIVPSPVLFRHYSHQLRQVEPVSGGDPWLLFDYMNIPQEQRLLALVHVISCLVPNIPRPILAFYGPHGAGKTNNSKVLKSVIDPSIMDTIISTRDYSEFIQTILTDS
ncbi:MAG: hypothetical protein OHK006_22500 [Thermodesulfovibrionales bacterium]